MAHSDGSKESLLDQTAQHAAQPYRLFKDSQIQTKTRDTILQKKHKMFFTKHCDGKMTY